MWYKVYGDGSLIDIIYANSSDEAITIAIMRHGNADVWFTRYY